MPRYHFRSPTLYPISSFFHTQSTNPCTSVVTINIYYSNEVQATTFIDHLNPSIKSHRIALPTKVTNHSKLDTPIHSLQPTTPFPTHKHTQKANSVIPQTQSPLDSPSILHHTLSKFAHIPIPTNPPIQRTTTRTHCTLTAPNLQTPSSPSQQWVTPSHYPANSSYCRVANGKSTYRTIRITSAHRPPVMFIFTLNTS